MRVRRSAVPVLLWCLATAASIAVASLALRPVLRTAIPSDSVSLEAEQERGHGGLMTQPQPSLPPPTSSRLPASAPPPSSARPPASSGAGTPKPPTTTAPPPRIVDGWTVTTGGDGVDTYLRSFRTDGGDAVIRIRDGVVSLVTATPRDGYSVSKAQNEPTRLVVQFVDNSGGSAWLVDAMWWQGGPHGEVTRIGT
ncbi:DNA mismatch repair protein MutL [Dactylosporangium sp. AC04546]|uniref:DNA mismatch repair protein MutL n=1 Tax=Dactylosporangium sp. AC04546 TaxID=2862460 RepID=UPI001EDDA466|nr:DNA mismatch repair protein MutL [Dactylosporangium sp. AC04546]WVK79811.1 DNA mismatch repair protein MutL [Dactylosporangium sp. AC04546]